MRCAEAPPTWPTSAAAGWWWGRADTRSRRTVELARVGARSGAAYATYAARSVLADDDTRDELRRRFELRTAEEVAATLGNMKGAANANVIGIRHRF